MILNNLALILSLGLLFMTKTAIVLALKAGDQQQVRVLLILRLGLGLSACSYLLHLLGPTLDLVRFASFLCTLSGSMLIAIGAVEHWNLRRERMQERSALIDAETDDGAAFEAPSPTGAGLPCLNSRARRVLWHALAAAQQRHQCCVDTDHVLLGLLQEPNSASADILRRLNINPENIRLALGQEPVPDQSSEPSPALEALPLAERAQRAFTLAGKEAHRFEKSSVGTDHLLLGLMLMGSGDAAVSLFRAGVTVESVRNEIQRSQTRR